MSADLLQSQGEKSEKKSRKKLKGEKKSRDRKNWAQNLNGTYWAPYVSHKIFEQQQICKATTLEYFKNLVENVYWFLNVAGSAVGETGQKNLKNVRVGVFIPFSSERSIKYNARICSSKLVEACS